MITPSKIYKIFHEYLMNIEVLSNHWSSFDEHLILINYLINICWGPDPRIQVSTRSIWQHLWSWGHPKHLIYSFLNGFLSTQRFDLNTSQCPANIRQIFGNIFDGFRIINKYHKHSFRFPQTLLMFTSIHESAVGIE